MHRAPHPGVERTIDGTLGIGSHVGGYEIRRRIGAGGMGVVYEATDPDGGFVALKVLQAQRLANPLAVGKFHDEAIAGLIVAHPNVAATLARGETEDGIPYLVMERVRGEMLAARLHRDRALSLLRAAKITHQVLSGLQALHAAGIVHGDVKADNVLVETEDDGSEKAKLIDLGLARVQFDSSPGDEPDEVVVAGTPEYMAPELIRGVDPSPASDVYAAGILLFELITGSTPFVGGSVEEIFQRHLSDPVVPPSLRRPACPPILDRIVLRALDKDPARRFRSAAAFASALIVAMAVLDDTDEGWSTSTFSREAPTVEWQGGTPRLMARRQRIARGTPSHGKRRRT